MQSRAGASGIALYLLYDELRSHVSGSATVALRHGYDVVRWERALGLYQEHRIQRAFIDWSPFLSFWNIYYGTIHFVMPVVALVTLWRRAPERYLRWRNVLLVMLTLGLLGFWLYPLMPPRLMPQLGFVDTAAQFFNFGPQQRVVIVHGVPTAASRAAFGNLFAAMPSLHVGLVHLVGARARARGAAPVGARAGACCTRSSRCSRSWSPRTIGSWTRSAGGWCSALAWLIVVGIERARGLPAPRRAYA